MRKLLSFLLGLITVCTPAAADERNTVSVAVMSVNDFHASFVRNDVKGIPGAAALLQTVDSLKRIYPLNVVVSGGDNFGGSYFYQATNGALMPTFLNALGIRLSALGNHEFDEGQRALAAKWNGRAPRPAGWDLTYVCANTRLTSNGSVPAFAAPAAVVSLPLPAGGDIKVGFAGLLTSMTPQQASVRRLGGLSFDGRYNHVLDSLLLTPDHGASLRACQLRIVLTHIGTSTDSLGRPYWNDRDADNLLETGLPEWHAAISSHTHHAVCGRVGNKHLPVVQGECNGRYVALLVARIDTLTREVTSLTQQLVPVTPKRSLIPAAERLQMQIDSLLTATRTAAGTPIGEVLTQAREEIPHDRNDKMRQTTLGLLVGRAYAEAWREAAHLSDKQPVIGATHIGSIRAGLPQGAVSVLDVGEALPFSNRLRVYKMDGNELRDLINFGLQNTRFGQLQTSDIDILRAPDGTVDKLYYIAPKSGKRTEIKPGKSFYLVVDEFITSGGDGYAPSLFPADAEVKAEGLPATTDAFINYLKRQPFI